MVVSLPVRLDNLYKRYWKVYANYNKPIEFYRLVEKKICFLSDKDHKLVNYIQEYFLFDEINVEWFDNFKTFIEENYEDFIISKLIKFDSDKSVYNISNKDYFIKIYMYDSRFKDKYIMSGEQIISMTISKTSLTLTVNSSFIDQEVLHSSLEELEKRSLDFVRADIEGEIEYLDGDDYDYI